MCVWVCERERERERMIVTVTEREKDTERQNGPFSLTLTFTHLPTNIEKVFFPQKRILLVDEKVSHPMRKKFHFYTKSKNSATLFVQLASSRKANWPARLMHLQSIFINDDGSY